ncbi:hypothetical protein [Aquibacillus salsiterrae]|uniref:Uncharacterized protein n=1 Tax=Aquibacillus salsiterrae TaxID=2950439 RepID=A0A9X3WDY8_9BACI|nr:hypothetical protein [Aquibacillus salsiterrae]MDC3415306.1 hypothetical protein [Aquibacillus salsiterrae]
MNEKQFFDDEARNESSTPFYAITNKAVAIENDKRHTDNARATAAREQEFPRINTDNL